jgi:hypothetical protein
MTIEHLNIDQIKLNPKNPRTIKDNNFKKLIKSIKEFPEMLEVRPIVVDDDMVVLGGNMRLKACKEAGLKQVPIIKFSQLTEEKKKEFIVKDNASYGEWDYDILKDWNKEILLGGGFDEWDLINIFGENEMEAGMKKAIEGSNFNETIDPSEYMKTNILFFNELMLEFEDDKIKKALREIKPDNDGFINDIKSIILKYGKDSNG